MEVRLWWVNEMKISVLCEASMVSALLMLSPLPTMEAMANVAMEATAGTMASPPLMLWMCKKFFHHFHFSVLGCYREGSCPIISPGLIYLDLWMCNEGLHNFHMSKLGCNKKGSSTTFSLSLIDLDLWLCKKCLNHFHMSILWCHKEGSNSCCSLSLIYLDMRMCN